MITFLLLNNNTYSRHLLHKEIRCQKKHCAGALWEFPLKSLSHLFDHSSFIA